MQRVENMDKFFKFVYVMIFLFSQFLVSAIYFHSFKPCVRDRDCPACPFNLKKRCRKTVSFKPCVRDRDCPTCPYRATKRCRKGVCMCQ
ncbi:unnamed protein product [Trifolium pratense]|uniref:Uncharacterized protein n=1 Tax=Trifolium pratense TaxID=57577 RepID=A0ACB0KRA0_TRIPR|nr:unnamed protein product [Trifolium pratense]